MTFNKQANFDPALPTINLVEGPDGVWYTPTQPSTQQPNINEELNNGEANPDTCPPGLNPTGPEHPASE